MLLFVLSSILQPLLAKSGFPEFQAKQFITVLEEMSERYEVVFSYETKLLRDVKVEFQFVKGERLQSALGRLLKLTGFQHKAIGKKYFVIFRNDKKGTKHARKLERKIKQIQRLENKGAVRLQPSAVGPQQQFKKITEVIVDLETKARISGTVTSAE